jgi:hypothetical protein
MGSPLCIAFPPPNCYTSPSRVGGIMGKFLQYNRHKLMQQNTKNEMKNSTAIYSEKNHDYYYTLTDVDIKPHELLTELVPCPCVWPDKENA